MKSATSSPNARPWTLGKGRPRGTAEVPPIRSARPWVDVVSHGISWVSILFRNKTVNFGNDRGLSVPTHHLVADLLLFTSRREYARDRSSRGASSRVGHLTLLRIAAPRPIPYPRSAPCSVRRARLAPPCTVIP